MTDTGERICVLTHRTDPDRPRRAAPGLLVCAGCADRIGRAVADLPRLWADLEHALAGTWRDRVGDDAWPLAIAENPLPLRPDVAEHRAEIVSLMASYARIVAEEQTAELQAEHGWDPARAVHPPVPRAPQLAQWLADRHWWTLRQPWADEYADAMTDLRATALAILEPTGIRRVPCGPCREHVHGPAVEGMTWPVPCPGTLVARTDAATDRLDHPTCDNCGEVVTLDHHAALRRGLDALIDTQAAAEHLGVAASTVRRWQTEGRVKASGQDEQGRSLWRLEALERVKRELDERAAPPGAQRLAERITGRVA